MTDELATLELSPLSSGAPAEGLEALKEWHGEAARSLLLDQVSFHMADFGDCPEIVFQFSRGPAFAVRLYSPERRGIAFFELCRECKVRATSNGGDIFCHKCGFRFRYRSSRPLGGMTFTDNKECRGEDVPVFAQHICGRLLDFGLHDEPLEALLFKVQLEQALCNLLDILPLLLLP